MDRRRFHRRARAPSPRLHTHQGVVRPSDLKEFFRREMSVAKRDGTWFSLGRVERGVYSLAMRLDVKFQSATLLRALVGVLKKLKEAGDWAYATVMDGIRLAWAFSEAASSGEPVGERVEERRLVRGLPRPLLGGKRVAVSGANTLTSLWKPATTA